MAEDMSLELFFDEVLKVLNQKVESLRHLLNTGKIPTRKEIEQFSWKTCRTLRLHIKPDQSSTRQAFWDECKGILKAVIVWENFNAGAFSSAAVKPEALEKTVLETLEKMLDYAKKRKQGKRPEDPAVRQKRKQEEEAAAQEAKRLKEEAEEEREARRNGLEYKGGGKGKGFKGFKGGKGGKGDKGAPAGDAAGWDDDADDLATLQRWDEEDSDPDEPCPDKLKYGNCSYGRQCGFCKRL
eukprot:TRINITY_DN39840_c0_g1_i1.p1 TRINITY_DN39840_c0_g1~~TRINITY_DN39840_c0_g1_i1.p1  ORF type:complete len:240 (+),score=87.74 TRINITY_DN39840_c0_g1_i1:136-855(+)